MLLLALLMRVGWAAVIRTEPVSDARAYHLLARQLATGGTYGFDGTPYAFWPVGYPLFLSAHYRLFGEESCVIAISSVVLSALTVGLAMVLAWQWFGDRRVAVIAGVILALYPVYIQFVTITASETLFTALFLAGLVCWGNRRALSVRRALLTGLCLGLASYVRPLALGVVIPLAAARWVSRSSLRAVLIESCVVLAVVAVTVSPWTYRNYRVYGRFVAVSTNGGMCLFFGNNPLAPDQYQAIVKPSFDGDDAARDAYCAAEAMRFIRSDPVAFLKRGMRKAIRMWERDTVGVVWNRSGIRDAFGPGSIYGMKVVSQGYWMLFVLMSAVGMFVVLVRQGWRAVLGYPGLWIILSFTAVYVVTFSQDRYHYPLVPLLAPLAAMSLFTFIERREPKQRWSRAPAFE